MEIEELILSELVFADDYCRKVIPFLKDDYFKKASSKVLFGLINDYFVKYNRLPNQEVLHIELQNTVGKLSEDGYNEARSLIDGLQPGDKSRREWLIDTTEKWCQERAIHNALLKSIRILDDTSGKTTKGSIPQLLTEALGVSFDTRVGHDYFLDWEHQWEFYHKVEHKVAFDIDYFNRITKGGISKKTLNIIMASTGVGKSMVMCHCAAAHLMMGKNVLYISMEMAEERIRERIDANLLDVSLDYLDNLSKEEYKNKVFALRERSQGTLIFREYPTGTASVTTFRHLLDECRTKKNFVPDVVYIDYLNICASARIKRSGASSYEYVKAIAEEIRGLAIEYDIPIISATQVNRKGYNNNDIELTETSESIGLPETADLMIALMVDDNLKSLGQILVKQLKNRYADLEKHKRFVVGVDRTKMRLYDVEESVQENVTQDIPVFDQTDTGSSMIDDINSFDGLDDAGVSKRAKDIFKDFK